MFKPRHVFGVILCAVAAISLTTPSPASAADIATGKMCGEAPAGLTDTAKIAAMDAQCASKTCAPGPTVKSDAAGAWYCIAEKKNCAWPDGDGYVDGDLKYSMSHRKLLRCMPASSTGARAVFTEAPR